MRTTRSRPRPSRSPEADVLRLRLTGWRWGFAVAAFIVGGVLAGAIALSAVLTASHRPGGEETRTLWIVAGACAAGGALLGWLLARSCRYTVIDPRRRVVQLGDGGAVPFEAVRAVVLHQTWLRGPYQPTRLGHVTLVTDRAGERFVARCRAAATLEPGDERPAPEMVEVAADLREDGLLPIVANAGTAYAERAAWETARRLDVVMLVVPGVHPPRFVRVPRSGERGDQRRSRYGLLDS